MPLNGSFRNKSAPSLLGRVGVGLLLCLSLSRCIEPYDAKIENIDSILVVEGIITSGTTQIILTKSFDIQTDYWWIFGGKNEELIYVDSALVYIECDDGTQSEEVHSSGKGVYLIETGELNVNAKYRLVIHVDDEVYHSSYLAPAISPPVELSYRINCAYFQKNEKNEKDSIVIYTDVFISTQGYEHQPGYYLWSYREDWEIHAPIYFPGYPYICWGKDSSRVFLLSSTDKLVENTIREHKLKYINAQDNKVSLRYRIQVKQNIIHKEAYDYFNNQKKNSEQTGTIFGVIPSELMGNIRCTSNPAIFVIGYVDVSTSTTDELYLDSECYDPPNYNYNNCEVWIPLPGQVPKDGIVWGYVEYGTGYILESCVDCTKRGGTEIKPEDWK